MSTDKHPMPIPQDFKIWYIGQSHKKPTSEAYKEWKRRGQQLCFEVAYAEGYQDAAEAAYGHLSCQPSLGLRERLQQLITTLEQKYEARGFEENYGDIMKRGGIFYLKQVLAWLEEIPNCYPEGGGEGEENEIPWNDMYMACRKKSLLFEEQAQHFRNIIESVMGECRPSVKKRIQTILDKYAIPAPEAQPIPDDEEEEDIYDAVRKYRDAHPEKLTPIQPIADGKEVPEWEMDYIDRIFNLVEHQKDIESDLLASRNKNNDDAIEIARLQAELKRSQENLTAMIEVDLQKSKRLDEVEKEAADYRGTMESVRTMVDGTAWNLLVASLHKYPSPTNKEKNNGLPS